MPAPNETEPDMKKREFDTPHKGSWADQESKRPKVQLTEKQKAQLRSGVIYPGWEHSVTLKVQVNERTT